MILSSEILNLSPGFPQVSRSIITLSPVSFRVAMTCGKVVFIVQLARYCSVVHTLSIVTSTSGAGLHPPNTALQATAAPHSTSLSLFFIDCFHYAQAFPAAAVPELGRSAIVCHSRAVRGCGRHLSRGRASSLALRIRGSILRLCTFLFVRAFPTSFYALLQASGRRGSRTGTVCEMLLFLRSSVSGTVSPNHALQRTGASRSVRLSWVSLSYFACCSLSPSAGR